jgi:hypothetical protein
MQEHQVRNACGVLKRCLCPPSIRCGSPSCKEPDDLGSIAVYLSEAARRADGFYDMPGNMNGREEAPRNLDPGTLALDLLLPVMP